MKKKIYVIFLVILLVIGFASVATNLIINGNLNIGFNSNDFNSSVIFTYANTETGIKAEINNNDKNIDFETERIENVNQTSVLEFDVTNKSRQYDASVTIVCGLNENFKSIEEYLSIDISLESPFELISGDTKTGIVTIKQNKIYSESLNSEVKFTCSLEATPIERNSLGNEIPVGNPEISILLDGDEIQQELPINLAATINSNGKKVNNAKWILNKDSELIGLDENLYTESLKDENRINIVVNSPGTYYLHILTKEKRIPQETISGPITITQNYHKHVDQNGNEHEESYQAETSGGCFTEENIVYGTIKKETHCDGTPVYAIHGGEYAAWGYAYRCNKCGYFFGYTRPSSCLTVKTTYEEYDTGNRYYTKDCGKTNDTFENYVITY